MKLVWVTLDLDTNVTGSVYCSSLSTVSRHAAVPQRTNAKASAAWLRTANRRKFAADARHPESWGVRVFDNDTEECAIDGLFGAATLPQQPPLKEVAGAAVLSALACRN